MRTLSVEELRVIASLTHHVHHSHTLIKLFREGGDEIGGFVIVNGERSSAQEQLIDQVIRSTTGSINSRIEKLMNQLGLAFIPYDKDPNNPLRMGCGFVIKSRKVKNPQNTINQIMLEQQVKQEKERLGKIRRVTMRSQDEMDIKNLVNEFLSLSPASSPQLSLSAITKLDELWSMNGRFPTFLYNNKIVMGHFTPFVLKNTAQSMLFPHILVVKFSNLKGLNDEYGHITADYYVLKLVETINEVAARCLSTQCARNVHIMQLRLLEMRVNNTFGILLDASDEECLKLSEEIKSQGASLYIEIGIKNSKATFLPITILIKNISEHRLSTDQEVKQILDEIYTELSLRSGTLLTETDIKKTSFPSQIQFPQHLEEENIIVSTQDVSQSEIKEPIWLHKNNISFINLLKQYLRTTGPYFLGNSLSAVSNYFSNLIFLRNASNQKVALTASSLMYAEQALLINPTLGMTSGTGILIAEVDAQKNYSPDVGNVFRHSIIAGMFAACPAIVIMLLSKNILSALHEPEDASSLVEQYFKSYVISMPFQMMVRVQQQMLYGANNTINGFLQQLSQATMSAMCAYLFMAKISGNAPTLGIQGLGYAMVCATAFNSLVMSLYLKRSATYSLYNLFHLSLHNSTSILKRLSAIGVPYASQMLVEQIGVLGAAIMAGWLGEAPSSALQITSRYVFPATILGFACGQSLGILMGRANGEGIHIKTKKLVIAALMCANLLLLPISIMLLTIPLTLAKPLIDFSDKNNKDVISLLPNIMTVQAITLLLDVTRNVLEGGLRGTGDSVFSLICNIFCMTVFMALGHYFAFSTKLGVSGLYLARAIGLCLINPILFYRLNAKLNYAIEHGYYDVSVKNKKSTVAIKLNDSLNVQISNACFQSNTDFKIAKGLSDPADSLFFAFANSLNSLLQRNDITEKLLREICYRHCMDDKDELLESEILRSGMTFFEYRKNISFAREEFIALHSNSGKNQIPGRPEIEGFLIAKHFDVALKIIKLNQETNTFSELTINNESERQATIYLIESDRLFFSINPRRRNEPHNLTTNSRIFC